MSDISEPIEGVAVLAPQPSSSVPEATHRLLSDPVLPLLLKLAWPNVLIMLAQASAGLIETWWVAHLGTDALAGMALSFPLVMLMQMMSAGAWFHHSPVDRTLPATLPPRAVRCRARVAHVPDRSL